MKNQILKIAKVKNEQEFYSKYPTEEAFMAKHGKAFKKAQMGASIQDKGQLKKLDQLTSFKKGGKLKKAQSGLEAYTSGQAKPALDASLSAIKGKANSSMNAALKGIVPGGDGFMNKLGGIGGAIDIGSNLIQGAGMLKEERDQKNQAKQFAALSGVVNQAASIRPEGPKRKYQRHEDMIFDPNQMSPTYGTGSNVLAQKGAVIPGYNKSDSSYTAIVKTPQGKRAYKGKSLDEATALKKALSKSRLMPFDSLTTKMYQEGGEIPQAQFGLDSKLGGIGSWAGSKLFGGTGEQSGAGKIGSTIGSVAGKFIPIPGADKLLGFAGGLIGGAIGAKNQKLTANWNKEGNANMANAAFMQGSQNIQNQYSGFMRSGGHLKSYTPPSEEAMQTYAMGGELQTHWGGEAETVSHNPYLPGNGESVEFKGQSHDDGGIGVTFGNSPVEVEGGEPAVKMQDGGNKENLVVFGDMKIPSYGVSEIGDPKAKGKKFKTYVNDLNKIEAKQNNVLDKGSDYINNADTNDPFERLKMNSGEAMLIGGNMKLKDIAKKKQMASIVQNAILETAQEHGLKYDELAKGNFKRDTKAIKNAQKGATIFDKILNPNPYEHEYGLYSSQNPSLQEHSGLDWTNNKPIGAKYANEGPKFDWQIPQIHKIGSKTTPIDSVKKMATRPIMPSFKGNFTPPKLTAIQELADKQQSNILESSDNTSSPKNTKDGLGWQDYLGAYLPYLRPTNQKNLDPNQLMGEMFALSSNNLEPVQSQRYNPLLEQATDYSFQDQLNANQADFNAIKRQAGSNPEALAALAGQKYGANSSVLANQFRTNQEQKQGVYNRNRGVLNDATVKNLGILDQQYVRQSQAKSNTKAVAQAALSSISDKIAKNKLENRTLGVYENLYNYRFGPQGRAWNMNAPVDFQQMVDNANPLAVNDDGITKVRETTKWDSKNMFKSREKQTTTEKKKSKNGSIVKAMKY